MDWSLDIRVMPWLPMAPALKARSKPAQGKRSAALGKPAPILLLRPARAQVTLC